MDERVVDQNTGEILVPKTVLLRSDEYVKVFNRQNGGRSIKFIKTRASQKSKRRFKKLTSHERGMLSIIALYALPNINMLVGDGEKGMRGQPLTPTDICEIGGYNKSTGYALIKSLVEKKVLGYLQTEGGKKAFVINPDYYINGNRAAPELLQLFKITPEKDE